MHYQLSFRSLTYAQRGARILERAGITATVSKLPKGISTRGCAYGLVVSQRHLGRALSHLENAGLSPENLFLRREDGSYEEVSG